MKTMDDAIEVIDEMLTLTAKKVELLRELKRALLIAQLVDLPLKQIKGKLKVKVVDCRRAPSFTKTLWVYMGLQVEVNGEVKTFPLETVPLDLWPNDLRHDYERHQRLRLRPKPTA